MTVTLEARDVELREQAEDRARRQLGEFSADLASARCWYVWRPHGEDGREAYLGRTWSAEAALAHLWAGNRLERAS